MKPHAAMLKHEIEERLSARIPAALSPMIQPVARLQASGTPSVDAMLGGGFPLGSLCEFTGVECSGRSSLAVSLLAMTSHQSACAYIDVSDSFSPHTAAAAGVLLSNLLWVRFPSQRSNVGARVGPDAAPLQREHPQNHQQSSGRQHPRGETKGLAPALEEMLLHKEESRRRKAEGTPGYPNQKLSLGDASHDQIEWEQFNSRKVDDRDPLRKLDKEAAEAARLRATSRTSQDAVQQSQTRPWKLLERAIRATDQILQAGGFRVVVLDLASVAPECALRIPSSTWWRFHKAAQQSDTLFLLLSDVPCARSSGACVLECSAGSVPVIAGVLMQAQRTAQVSRQRAGNPAIRKGPGRVTSWNVAPAWMRSVGK